LKEAEEDDRQAKEASDRALGLEGGAKGPPMAKAEEQRANMSELSNTRRNIIAEQQSKEVTFDHKGVEETIVVTTEEVGSRALRLDGCRDVAYTVPEGVQLLKLFVDRCERVKIHLENKLITSVMEISHCSDVEVRARCPLSTVQCDECTQKPVRLIFSEPEHVATFFHQNSPALEIALDGEEVAKVGKGEARQLVTRHGPNGFATEVVVRGESEFPLNLQASIQAMGCSAPLVEPEAEASPAAEEKHAQAEARRSEGNAAFRANDFVQAAVFYTEAIDLCPDLHLAWANRAQCFLQTGDPEKALHDATRCTELAPEYAKGWFRRGMALHALRRFGEAIPPLTQAEKLDPKNSQIPEAIKMAQLMARRHGPGESR